MPPNNQEAVPYRGPVFDPRAANGNEDYFWYSVTVAAISTVVPNPVSQIQFDADSEFLWIATSYQADIAAATLTEQTNVIPLVDLAIQDTGSGKYLMNGALPLTAIAGDGKRPYRLIGPRVIQPSSVVNFSWTNAVAAGTTYRIKLVLHGIKRFK